MLAKRKMAPLSALVRPCSSSSVNCESAATAERNIKAPAGARKVLPEPSRSAWFLATSTGSSMEPHRCCSPWR